MTISPFAAQIQRLTFHLEDYILPTDRPALTFHLENHLYPDNNKPSSMPITAEDLKVNLNSLKENLIENWESTKSFEEDEITLLYRMRRTLEAAIMTVHCPPPDSIGKLKNVTALGKLQETVVKILKLILPLTPLKEVEQGIASIFAISGLCELVADYADCSEDQTFAHAIISAGYQDVIIEKTRMIGQIKINCGYNFLRRLICRQNRPMHFRRICTWDLYQLARKPEDLLGIDFNQYAQSPRSLVKIVSLLEWTDQMRPGLIASTLSRTCVPLNLEFIPPSLLVKHASYIHSVVLNTARGFFSELIRTGSVSHEVITKILARSLVPLNINQYAFKQLIEPDLQSSINWKTLIDNLDDDKACLDLEMGKKLAERLFTELEKQDPSKGRQRALTIVAKSLVYGSESLRYNYYFPFKELWPTLLKELKNVDLDKLTFQTARSYSTLLSELRRDPLRHPNFTQFTDSVNQLLQYIADNLKSTSFLAFGCSLRNAISCRILELMPNDDRRHKIIVNSISRGLYAAKTLAEFKVSEAQIVESLHIFISNNIVEFNPLGRLSDGNYEALSDLKYCHSYLKPEHIEIILKHLPPEFGFSSKYPETSIRIIEQMDPHDPNHAKILNNTFFRMAKKYSQLLIESNKEAYLTIEMNQIPAMQQAILNTLNKSKPSS